MNMKKVLGIGFIILVVSMILSGFYFWFSGHKQKLAAENKRSPEEVIATTTSIVGQKPIEKPTATFPKYTGQAINTIGNDPLISQLPASAVEIKKQQLADLTAALSKKPDDFNSWMALGNFKKFFNNFIGARDAWEYAKIIVPNQPLTYLNLANLYGYYLNNHNQAELNYLAAINLDSLNAYGGLTAVANYYRDFGMKDKALEFYKKALEFTPGDSVLQMEIQRLSE